MPEGERARRGEREGHRRHRHGPRRHPRHRQGHRGAHARIDGYTVHDLGTDVPVEEFVAAIKERDADIVALSGLLTLAFDAMRSTVDGIAAAGLRDTGQDHDRRRRRWTRTCARTPGPTAGAATWVTPSSSPPSGPTEAPDAARSRGEARRRPHRSLGERRAPALRERRGQAEVPGQSPAHRRHHPAQGHRQDPGHPGRHPEVRLRLRPGDVQGGDDRVRQGVRRLRAPVRGHGVRRLRRPRVHLPGGHVRGAGLEPRAPARRPPARRQVVPVRGGRVHEGRRVRRVPGRPLGLDPAQVPAAALAQARAAGAAAAAPQHGRLLPGPARPGPGRGREPRRGRRHEGASGVRRGRAGVVRVPGAHRPGAGRPAGPPPPPRRHGRTRRSTSSATTTAAGAARSSTCTPGRRR